jgi:transcription termination factor Rho
MVVRDADGSARLFEPKQIGGSTSITRIPSEVVANLGLRTGLQVELSSDGSVSRIEDSPVESWLPRPDFAGLTAIDPCAQIRLETGKEPLSTRLIDLWVPVGKGQRGLIVAPPRTGKTVLLEQIAHAVEANHPEITVLVVLVDERPEEVTQMRRSVRAEVYAAANDQPVERQIAIADFAFERGRRIAERGRDAIILLDSLTRLARAHNRASDSGRTMSGGVDIKALDWPKRQFGSARACEEGGSLTVLATCLVETGSRGDEVIFREFQGTGNLELVLEHQLAERRIWPAIDLPASGTRKEEKLLPSDAMNWIRLVRKTLADKPAVESLPALLKQLARDDSNESFLRRLAGAQSKTGT